MEQNNHLIIGLGGTGCSVVRELKKLLYTEWKRQLDRDPNRPEQDPEIPQVYEFSNTFGSKKFSSRIATLSVDSNAVELEGSADKWRIMGRDLSLTDGEKVLLDKAGLDTMVSNLTGYPGVSPWVKEDLGLIEEITRGSAGAEGCDQIRRLGRLAIADRSNLNKLMAAVDAQKTALTRGGVNNMDIHIALTLGCGTGSGTFIDIIAQLNRRLKDQAGDFPIYLYVFVTGDDVPADMGKFHANQYGALQELNGLRLGNYKPWNIAADSEPERLLVEGAFASCFLISNVADGGQTLSLDEQVNSAAEFLFQKQVRLSGNIPKELHRSHTFEDVKDYPADEPGSDRSTRFASFGIKRLAIPEMEIRMKMGDSFARSFLLQMLYGNWNSDNGYSNAAAAFDDDSFVQSNVRNWKIGDTNLSLDVAEGQDEFRIEWAEEARIAMEDTQITYASKDASHWDEAFDGRLDDHWENGFRGRGVDAYFGARTDENSLNERARFVVSAIEKQLIDGLTEAKDGYVLHNLPKVVSRAVKHVEEGQKRLQARLGEIDGEIAQAEAARLHHRAKLDNAGMFSKALFKTHEKAFSSYRDASEYFYSVRTEKVAADYGVKFADKLISSLNGLLHTVVDFDTSTKQWVDFVEGQLETRLAEDEVIEDKMDEEVIKYVNPKEVNYSIGVLLKDKERIDQVGKQMLATLRSKGNSFSDYTNGVLFSDGSMHGRLVEQLQLASLNGAKKAHDSRVKNDPQFRAVLGQNIVDKLAADHGGTVTPELEVMLEMMMNKSRPSLAFDYSADPVLGPPVAPIGSCSVFIPECGGDNDAFRQRIASRLGTMTGKRKRAVEIVDIPQSRDTSEIVFLSTAAFFPLRMAKPVVALKKRFESSMKRDERRTRFLHFGETHNPGLPDLMKLSDSQRRESLLAYLVIADNLGLTHIPDPEDELSNSEALIGRVEKKGKFVQVRDKIELGINSTPDTRASAADSLNRYEMEIPDFAFVLLEGWNRDLKPGIEAELKARVESAIQDGYRAPTARKELKEKITQFSDYVFLIQNGREDDELYKFWQKITEEAGAGIIDSVS